MQLSDEEKKRILEEEQQRLAEEQFRAEVRRGLVSGTGAVGAVPAKSKTLRIVLIALGVLYAVFVVLVVIVKHPFPTGSHSVTPMAESGAQPTQASTADRPSPLSPPPPTTLTTAQIAERATTSVVVVENFNEDGEKVGQGSGYVCSTDGAIITNYHVIRGASSLNIRLPSKESFHVDSVLGYDIEHDVAALQLSGGSIPALETEGVEQAKVGDRVIAIGAPLGLESTVSEGIISALRDAGGTHVIQTTASISPGSSGGPLLNEYGRVIGLTTSQLRNGQNLNFAISTSHVSELLSHKRQLSLLDMLNETRVVESLPVETITIPARKIVAFPFMVPGQQGAVLEGSYTITGGRGSDLGVALVGPGASVLVNSGRVSGSGEFRKPLPPGQYAIIFDNRFSTLSSKSVSPDLRLSYYR